MTAPGSNGSNGAGRVMRDETLGDRIGERMRSRLAEMCVVIEMRGEDSRRTVGRARFGSSGTEKTRNKFTTRRIGALQLLSIVFPSHASFFIGVEEPQWPQNRRIAHGS